LFDCAYAKVPSSVRAQFHAAAAATRASSVSRASASALQQPSPAAAIDVVDGLLLLLEQALLQV
jgi:hypothetical protein